MADWLPWVTLLVYGVLIWRLMPAGVTPIQFFRGSGRGGVEPGFWLLVASAAITWLFAKSIANAASLGQAFGLVGGIGYGLYYLSFIVAAVGIWFIRVRGGHGSLAGFLVAKYGTTAARIFFAAIAIRLFNEVWSNTKVVGLFFGTEGSAAYWLSAVVVTAFTAYYSWRGGLRSSLLTDGAQMVLAAVLLVVIALFVWPDIGAGGLPGVGATASAAGWTFCGLALIQALSYPFHDPVLTDRAFLTRPGVMVRAFVVAGLIGALFIVVFSGVGIYARLEGLSGNPSVSVAMALGLPLMLVFNVIMVTSAGSTLDSTFSSASKLAARDWHKKPGDAGSGGEISPATVARGRAFMVAIAVLGNLPLLSIYMGDRAGPAVIAATTISGTMVMGLAPIFLLAFVRGAGRLSFHLAFWPGLALGVLMVVDSAAGVRLVPDWSVIGSGKYADDFGVNVLGLAVCTVGYLMGALPGPWRVGARLQGPRDSRSETRS